MLSARSIKKLLILLSIMVPMSFAAAEARRAYQTADDQISLDASDVEDAADNSSQAVVTTPKRQTQSKQDRQDKQDKQTRVSVTKTVPEKQSPEQLLTSPLDVMMQYENDRQVSLNKDIHTSGSGKPSGTIVITSSSRALSASNSVIAVKKKTVTPDKALKPSESQNAPKSPFGSPVEVLITALAIGVCLYSLSKKLLFKSSLKSPNLT